MYGRTQYKTLHPPMKALEADGFCIWWISWLPPRLTSSSVFRITCSPMRSATNMRHAMLLS